MTYHARQGDVIWLTRDPQAGHEQKGRRPALVVSNDGFNAITGYGAMVCPITNTQRNNPAHIKLAENMKTTGVVMCDQAKILDLRERSAEYIERASDDLLEKAVNIVIGIVTIEK